MYTVCVCVCARAYGGGMQRVTLNYLAKYSRRHIHKSLQNQINRISVNHKYKSDSHNNLILFFFASLQIFSFIPIYCTCVFVVCFYLQSSSFEFCLLSIPLVMFSFLLVIQTVLAKLQRIIASFSFQNVKFSRFNNCTYCS